METQILTVFALALFDESLVFDVVVTRFAVEPRSFHLVCALRDEEALRVGVYLSTTWIDGDLAVRALLALDLDRQQQQL